MTDRWRWFADTVDQSVDTEVCSALCFYAGADHTVCPVSLVDFYL